MYYTIGIYKIKNILNNKIYIGQSIHIEKRWKEHKWSLNNNCSSNRHLQFAWNKYGEENFKFEIIEICEKYELDKREVFWISKLNSFQNGYNLDLGGKGSKGHIKSEETIKKLKNALSGRLFTAEHCKNISRSKKEYYESHRPSNCIQIVCLNTKEIFSSAFEASISYKSADDSSIISCCKGKLLSAGKDMFGSKLVWRYFEDYKILTDLEVCDAIDYAENWYKYNPCGKPVICLSNNKIFKNCTIAAKEYGISISNLNGCLKGRQKTAGKEKGQFLKWQYYEDYINALSNSDYITVA